MSKLQSFDLSIAASKNKNTTKQAQKKTGVDLVYRYALYALLDAGEFQSY